MGSQQTDPAPLSIHQKTNVCGTRISETIAIHYYDIDFTSLIVYINKQLGRSINKEIETRVTTQEITPKTHKAVRTIPLPDWVADELILKRA